MSKKIIATVLASVFALTICFGANQAISSKAAAEPEVVEAEVEAPAESITEDDALSIAIGAAGFSESNVRYPKVIDGDDSIKVIFTVGEVEFAYTIDKANGEITDRQVND